eukprot:snap_masked-scaffold_3-processed-gene-11.36-mRNA-1 protein AED:1.00 eAED:1.00 QI:0/0/0/0/1/1/2/0/71
MATFPNQKDYLRNETKFYSQRKNFIAHKSAEILYSLIFCRAVQSNKDVITLKISLVTSIRTSRKKWLPGEL